MFFKLGTFFQISFSLYIRNANRHADFMTCAIKPVPKRKYLFAIVFQVSKENVGKMYTEHFMQNISNNNIVLCFYAIL